MMLRGLLIAGIVGVAMSGIAADMSGRLRPCFRNISPEARAELAKCRRAAESWRPHEARPRMFVRGQFFYGNELAGYIHAWYERPLHQDTSMAAANEQGRMLNPLSWKRTVRTAREMKLDGFAFFPLNPGCLDVFPRSVMPGGEVPILMQFWTGHLSNDFGKCVELAEKYRSAPNAYRLDGRPVIVGYPDLFTTDDAVFDLWKRYRRTLAEKFGPDAFVVMPGSRIFALPDLDRPELTAETIAHSKDHIRNVLRAMDGIFICQWEVDWGVPENLAMPTDEIVGPIVKSVLAEPEFRGKYLGYEFYQAHENPYRRVVDLASGGMVRLLSALESIDRMRPDFAFGSEWDEQNENVHFRPTVSNGQTTQRVMRYYADRMAGTAPTPYPGDDTSIPNLILTYRKMIAVGEPAEVQVCNVPDGTASGDWTVSFRWKTPEGRTVREFRPQRLSAATCAQVVFRCSSVELAEHRVLRPELTVKSAKDGERTFAEGFWPMSIDAIRVMDNKWVRHALREICADVSGRLLIGQERAADGTYEVRASVSGPRKFRSIEVLADSDSVYMHDASRSAPTNDEVEVGVFFSALGNYWETHCPTGWVRALHAPHALPKAINPYWAVSGGANEWLLPKRGNQRESFYAGYGFRIPRAETDAAEIEIGLPDEFGVRAVRVADVLKEGAYSYSLPGGAQVVVSCWSMKTATIPPPPNVNAADFTFRIRPMDPNAVLRLQVVDEDYRIWRGPVACFGTQTGKVEEFHVFDEVTTSAKTVKLDRGRLYALRYDFGDGRGDQAESCGGHLDSPCVFGGGIGAVVGVGTGGCMYQHALSEGNPNFAAKPGGCDTVPKRVREPDGTWSIAFSNCNFATLPLRFVPRHAGFKLSMRIRPDSADGVQWLFDSGNLGLQMFLKDGVPEAFLSFGNEMHRIGKNETAGLRIWGDKLKPGEWNDMAVVFDQSRAWIEVNGRAGKVERGCGYELNPRSMSFGCSLNGAGFFCGRIADLRIRPN